MTSNPGLTAVGNKGTCAHSRLTPSLSLPAAAAAVFFVAGCASIDPAPLTEGALLQGARTDRKSAEAASEPIRGPLNLEEAIARALKYNLDRRVRLIEESVALGTFEAGKFDMLPRLLAQAGYRSRSEELITRSKDSVTGLPSLANPSIATDRSTSFTDLGLTWSLLDFGTGYYNALQNADRLLVAAERRRKAMHVLMQDVRTAFWRAASAQRLEKDVRDAIALAEEALADARKAEAERVRSPIDSLRYQRQVLENLRLLETAQQELSTARTELALLINAPLGAPLLVAEPDASPSRRILSLPVERLEEVAVARNADLREQFYNARIATQETRKVITRLFPNLSFNYNVKYDSNSFLVHNGWNEAGLSLSYNLLNIFSGPTQMKLAEAGVALADQRRVATQMATLTQVHIARLQYSNALLQLDRAEGIAGIDGKISSLSDNREQARVQSKLEAVAMRATSILSMMRRYQALAQAYAAASKLQMTLGLEPVLESVDDASLGQVGLAVRRADLHWDEGKVPDLPKAPDAKPAAPNAKETKLRPLAGLARDPDVEPPEPAQAAQAVQATNAPDEEPNFIGLALRKLAQLAKSPAAEAANP